MAITVKKQRNYLSQADVPSVSLEKAMRVPNAIRDNYGHKPTAPLHVAKALEVQPSSSGFKMLTGASIAYGLTTGGYNAETIGITQLGMRIVRPTSEGDDLAAKREAILRPRVVREFLMKYDGAPVPKEAIALNVLEEMGVPHDRRVEVFNLIMESAESVGFIHEIKDRKYVDLAGASQAEGSANFAEEAPDPSSSTETLRIPLPLASKPELPAPFGDARARRVFLTHGKNMRLIEPVKKLLTFGELNAVVAVQEQTVSQPVPSKVLEGMRSCGAAIIHVDGERYMVDKEGNQHVILNDNVLIEIGAAMALYGQRFILIVKDGVRLPSNLQGLLELRYKGETLDVEETVRLIDAINDMKKRPLPS